MPTSLWVGAYKPFWGPHLAPGGVSRPFPVFCLLCLSEHGITLHPSLLSSQFSPTHEPEKPDLNHLAVGNQDGPGLEKRVGSAISVISNAVEGTSPWLRVLASAGGPGLGTGAIPNSQPHTSDDSSLGVSIRGQ